LRNAHATRIGAALLVVQQAGVTRIDNNAGRAQNICSPRMKTEDLRAFDAVVRNGSISEAAHALEVTQSAITRRIQSLEEALGVTLLDRSTKPPRPSALGLRVHQQTRAVLREIDALGGLVTRDATPSGHLRLGLTHSMGAIGLVEVLARLRKSYPQVEMQVSTDWSARLVAKVAAGDLDAATVFMPATAVFPDTVQAQRLASTEVVAVARRGSLAKAPTKLRDVYETGWVLNPPGCGFRAALERALAERGLPLRLNLETFGSELQLGLAAAGQGVGLVSRPALEASQHAKQLEVLALRDFRMAVDLWLVGSLQLGNLERPVQQFGQEVAAGHGARPTRPARR
jgi:DNA-binding transcriptional LysR family regulator